jgi:hypothetical protein
MIQSGAQFRPAVIEPTTPPPHKPRLLVISALVGEIQEKLAGVTVEVKALKATPLTVAAEPPLIA